MPANIAPFHQQAEDVGNFLRSTPVPATTMRIVPSVPSVRPDRPRTPTDDRGPVRARHPKSPRCRGLLSFLGLVPTSERR